MEKKSYDADQELYAELLRERASFNKEIRDLRARYAPPELLSSNYRKGKKPLSIEELEEKTGLTEEEYDRQRLEIYRAIESVNERLRSLFESRPDLDDGSLLRDRDGDEFL